MLPYLPLAMSRLYWCPTVICLLAVALALTSTWACATSPEMVAPALTEAVALIVVALCTDTVMFPPGPSL